MMKMMDGIHVSEEALEACYYACEKELFIVLETKKTSRKEQMFRFVQIELALYVKVAFFGLLIGILAISLLPHAVTLIVSGYFLMIGSYAIFEYFKNKYYGVQELMAPVYYHPARVFLMKSTAIGICQLLILFFFIWLDKLMGTAIMKELLLYSLIPLYSYQLIMLMMMNHIHHCVSPICCYFGFYGVYLFCFELFQLQTFVTLPMLCSVSLLILGMFGGITVLKLRGIERKGVIAYEFTN